MTDQILTLIPLRAAAKAEEDAAVSKRRGIDAQIAALMADPSKAEGTVSHKTDEWKVTVTYGQNRKMNTQALRSDWDKLTPSVQGAIKWMAELNTTEFRKLAPDAVLALSTYMETKPSTPSVKVEPITK